MLLYSYGALLSFSATPSLLLNICLTISIKKPFLYIKKQMEHKKSKSIPSIPIYSELKDSWALKGQQELPTPYY